MSRAHNFVIIFKDGKIMNKFENDSKLIKVNGDVNFKLLDVLKANNITRYKLSRISGIRYDTICNYCKGDITLLNKEYIKILCSILNCNVSDLIEYIPNKKE